jgi:hypothetical protein
MHFKAEHLWMLRLLSAGSNLADDAKIYKRGRVLELALAFCSSPVSDFESKVLVLKVNAILIFFSPDDFLDLIAAWRFEYLFMFDMLALHCRCWRIVSSCQF